jgi:hypothetical protein
MQEISNMLLSCRNFQKKCSSAIFILDHPDRGIHSGQTKVSYHFDRSDLRGSLQAASITCGGIKPLKLWLCRSIIIVFAFNRIIAAAHFLKMITATAFANTYVAR